MHRMMSRESIAARRAHAKEIMRKNPHLTIDEVRERSLCSQHTVSELRRELAKEKEQGDEKQRAN